MKLTIIIDESLRSDNSMNIIQIEKSAELAGLLKGENFNILIYDPLKNQIKNFYDKKIIISFQDFIRQSNKNLTLDYICDSEIYIFLKSYHIVYDNYFSELFDKIETESYFNIWHHEFIVEYSDGEIYIEKFGDDDLQDKIISDLLFSEVKFFPLIVRKKFLGKIFLRDVFIDGLESTLFKWWLEQLFKSENKIIKIIKGSIAVSLNCNKTNLSSNLNLEIMDYISEQILSNNDKKRI